ncbi:MAG: glycosyltransferase family 39 protein [Planctomycetes bacterium]|nr:glycosyltransferase family 39 protein [Planctomycetota bacterium]
MARLRPPVRFALLMTLLLGAALAVRLAAAAWWESRLPEGVQFGFGDSQSYWVLAESIARGGPYEYGENGPRVFRTPGYPLVLAPLFLMYTGEPPTMAARVLGAMLGTLAVAGVAGLAWTCFDARTALAAATLGAIYPGAVAMSVFVLSEAPFCPLMLLQLIVWTKAWKSDDRRTATFWSLAGGVAAGAATLMRPSWLLFTPFALAIGLIGSRARMKHARLGIMMLAALAATMAPWWVRNYIVVGRFVPTTLQVGASLYDGLSPQATGASDMAPGDELQRRLRQSYPADLPPAKVEAELDEHLRQAALDWARRRPGRALELAWIKLLRIWNIWPNAAEFQSIRLRLIVAIGYTPLLVLGLWGAWRFAPRGWPYVLCLLPAIYFTALHVIFVGSIRYRQPAMLSLIVLAAGVLTSWWSGRSALAHEHPASPGRS